MTDQQFEHVPVLLEQAIRHLAIRPGGQYVDGTAGGAGHATAILERSSPDGRLLALDVDPRAVETARQRLAPFGQRATVVRANFERLADVAREHGFAPADGVLLDLGVSSFQFADPSRGFSFQTGGPLDMRLGGEGVTAAEIVNTLGEQELADVIFRYGEERQSRRIARAIVAARPVETAEQLRDLVQRAVGHCHNRTHPATRTFQAIRIAVNRELEVLTTALAGAVEILRLGGRLVVISFHSLEDRIVKTFIRQQAHGCTCPPALPACVCGKQPTLVERPRGFVAPMADEVRVNPRARSAKLRAAEKIGSPNGAV